MPTTVRIETQGWTQLRGVIESIGNRGIVVGIMDDGDMAKIGAIHEYGAEKANIPERSFIRATLREEREAIDRQMERVGRAYMKGKIDVDTALGLVGQFAVNAIKRKIRSNIAPPLTAGTIKRKGSSLALVDTGRMLNSVTWKVVG